MALSQARVGVWGPTGLESVDDLLAVQGRSKRTFIAHALGVIARAKGMSQLARDTGLGRESLYKALSGEGNPSFGTILKVMHALGVRLHAEAA